MRLFCSYAYTGENEEIIRGYMQQIVAGLKRAGHEPYCPLFDPHKATLQKNNDLAGIFSYSFENIIASQAIIALVASARRSEGMLMEIGAGISRGLPLYLLVHESAEDAPSHLPKLATKVISWTDGELEKIAETIL